MNSSQTFVLYTHRVTASRDGRRGVRRPHRLGRPAGWLAAGSRSPARAGRRRRLLPRAPASRARSAPLQTPQPRLLTRVWNLHNFAPTQTKRSGPACVEPLPANQLALQIRGWWSPRSRGGGAGGAGPPRRGRRGRGAGGSGGWAAAPRPRLPGPRRSSSLPSPACTFSERAATKGRQITEEEKNTHTHTNFQSTSGRQDFRGVFDGSGFVFNWLSVSTNMQSSCFS